jgi:hypothetical protein
LFYLTIHITKSKEPVSVLHQVDVEGAELEALPEWLESGALDRVLQLAMELHLPTIHMEVVVEQIKENRNMSFRPGFPGCCPYCSIFSSLASV